MNDSNLPLTPQEQAEWQRALEIANQSNVFCHCRDCDREWVTSRKEPCACGSTNLEFILCWQFPDG